MGGIRGKRVLCGLLLGLSVGLMAVGCGGGGRKARIAEDQPPAVGRPERATAGPRVGVIVVATPGVQVEPREGPAFAATQGTMLVRSDRLAMGSAADSFAVVELYNGHLVRLSQGADVVVEKLAVFDAPPAGDDLAQRFEKMLRKEELADEDLRGAISRVAGWNSRMTAAETIATMPSKRETSRPPPTVETPNAPRMDRPLDPPGGPEEGDGPQKNAPDDHGPGLEDGPSKNKLPDRPADKQPTGSDDGGVLKVPEPMPRTDPSSADTKKSSDTVPDLPDRVGFKPDDKAMKEIDLPQELKAERKALAACAGRGATVKVRVMHGEIQKIEVSDGKKCSLSVKKLQMDDGVLQMEVK